MIVLRLGFNHLQLRKSCPRIGQRQAGLQTQHLCLLAYGRQAPRAVGFVNGDDGFIQACAVQPLQPVYRQGWKMQRQIAGFQMCAHDYSTP